MSEYSTLPEITHLNERINELAEENERLIRKISTNDELIRRAKANVFLMEERKNNEIFDYQPLINGKINGIQIKSIKIHGCQCLENKKCDAMHNICIYDMTSNERINFNNEKNFSIDELEKLNYMDKLEITADDDWKYDLMNGCRFAKSYPNKVGAYGYWAD